MSDFAEVDEVELSIIQGSTLRRVITWQRPRQPAGWAGYWNPSTDYAADVVVGHDRKHWRSLRPSSGVAPSPSVPLDWAEVPIVWEGVDLAGYEAKLQVRAKRDKTSQLYLTVTSDPPDGITLQPGGALGEIHIVAKGDKTGAVPKSGFWDIELWPKSDPNDTTRIAGGTAPLSKQVTD